MIPSAWETEVAASSTHDMRGYVSAKGMGSALTDWLTKIGYQSFVNNLT